MRPDVDGADEPLIRQVRRSSYDDSTVDHGNDSGAPGVFIWVLTFCAGVSGLLFGYDTGVISSTLVSIGSDLSSHPLTTLDKSLITSSTSLFALLSSPISGLLADRVGRKPVILIADALFILGALWQAFTSSVWGMIFGRSLIGLAVGSASFVTPLYISEASPARWRGRLVMVSSLFITGGQVVAYLVGWAFSGANMGWRYMVGLGAIPAVLQLISLLGMPETPRWLVKSQKIEQAKVVLMKMYGLGSDRLVHSILKSVEDEVAEEEAARKVLIREDEQTWTGKHFLSLKYTINELVRVGGNRRALIIACLLQSSQQLCGFNSLMYFSATIFAMVGFRNPVATSLVVACTNFIFTLATFHYIDRLGRRRILLLSIPIMAIGLAICALAFNFLHLPSHSSPTIISIAKMTKGFEVAATGIWPLIIVLSMVLYVASYAMGLGCVPWQQSELFPLSVRSLGSSLATATNWGSNTIVGVTFLPMMDLITPTWTFALYAAICIASWVAVWRIYPETAGLGLEEVGQLLKEGWGVKDSLSSFKDRQRKEREEV